VTERRKLRMKKKFIKFEKKQGRKMRSQMLGHYRPEVEKFDPVFG